MSHDSIARFGYLTDFDLPSCLLLHHVIVDRLLVTVGPVICSQCLRTVKLKTGPANLLIQWAASANICRVSVCLC